MSQLHDEKDNSSTSTQKTLDIFFRSSNNNLNVNGTNVQSIANISGQDSGVTSKDEYLVNDAGTGVSTDQQDFFVHDESTFVPEQRNLVNNSNEADLTNPVISDGLGGAKLDDVTPSAKVCLNKFSIIW